MRRNVFGIAVMALTLGSAVAVAQPGPAPRRGGGPGGPSGAEVFLARTGDLKLTDAQVTRLAAIARRTDERRRAIRASMDSMSPGVRRDSAARAQSFDRMRTTMERERDQSHADLRDALAVLTPEQLATAWEMRGVRGGPDGPVGPGPDGPRVRERQMRRAPADRQRQPRP